MSNLIISASQNPPPEPDDSTQVVDLLRQILAVQQQHLEQSKAHAAAHDQTARWRSVLERWQEEFPGLAADCQKARPILERAYGTMLANMMEELVDQGDEALDNDFAVQEFLDRYGMRLGQLGGIMSLVGPLAEAAAQNEKANQ